MNSNNVNLYMKIEKNNIVKEQKVKLGDFVKFECSDKNIVNHIKTITLLTFPPERKAPYVVSVLKVIQLINDSYPGLVINNEGEFDFIIALEEKKSNKVLEFIKIVFVSLIVFFGGAFTIMSFNNDVSINEMFIELFELFTGDTSDGRTVLELTYSVGTAIGVLVFFNHFKIKKLESDPTPIQVEMQIYEEDVNTALVDTADRKGEIIDAD